MAAYTIIQNLLYIAIFQFYPLLHSVLLYFFIGSSADVAGIVAGIYIGIPLLVLFICFGISIISGVLYFKCYKRQRSGVRTRNVAENLPDYKMSEVAAKESNITAYVSTSASYVGGPAPPYTATAYSSQPQQQKQEYPPAAYVGAPAAVVGAPAPPYTPAAYTAQPQQQQQGGIQASGGYGGGYGGSVAY